jgi:hypothetical protein
MPLDLVLLLPLLLFSVALLPLVLLLLAVFLAPFFALSFTCVKQQRT